MPALWENIRQLPESWLAPFLADYKARLNEKLRNVLDTLLADEDSADDVSIPHGYGIDTSSDFSQHNTNANVNSISNVTPTLNERANFPVDKSGIPLEIYAQVEAAIAKAQRRGIAKGDPRVIIEAVAKRYQAGSPPRDAGAYTYSIAQSLANVVAEPSLPAPPSKTELKAWAGLCFCWPTDNPSSFIRVDEAGFCEQVTLESGKARHGYAPLGRSKLLDALREGRLQPVSVDVFEDLVKGARL